ncbi:MAG TPA: hypothetical protein VF653_00965 [Methylomirabilota bacterium]
MDAMLDAGWSEPEALAVLQRAGAGDWQLRWMVNCLTVLCWTRAEAEAALEEYRQAWRDGEAAYRAELRCHLVELGLVDWWDEYWDGSYVDEVTGQHVRAVHWLGEAPAENPCN